ncbi:MAG TPA: glycosyltransferase [Acidobacteriaceae bacterium]|nr:glycosyltransferase [Acidobacteriaceae bacterium]
MKTTSTQIRGGRYEVLHLIGSNLVGGPEKQILHHAQDMQDTEYQLAIGSFHDLKDRPEVLVAAEQRNIPTVCLPGGVRLDLVHHLAKMLSQRRVSLLCTHGFKANVVGYLATRRTGTPHVAFVRGFTAENRRVRFYEMLERQALKRADRVVCVSESQAKQIAPLRGNRRAPIVVKNAMLPPYSRQQNRPAISRKDLSIPKSAFIFGSVGRLSTEKGHRFMVSAFHKLCTESPVGAQLYLIIVGDGNEEQPLKQQATQLGIREQMHFAGFQGSPTEWMQLMDCLVQPSLTEGTPNTVLEALCLKVPVIASAVGGVPDLIVDGRNGLLVPAADVDQMAAAMKKMWLLPDLRSQLTAGAEDLLQEYSPAYQRQRLMDVYDEVFRDGSISPRSS